MESPVMYQNPPMDTTGSWARMLNANLQKATYFSQLYREDLQGDLDLHSVQNFDLHQRVQKQIRKHFQSVDLQQFCSTEPQKQMLENTSYLHNKSSTRPIGSVRNTSTVSKSNDIREYFLGHELQTPVEKPNFDISRFEKNFENERKQFLLEMQSYSWSGKYRKKSLHSNTKKMSTKPLVTKTLKTGNKQTDSKAKNIVKKPKSRKQKLSKDIMCFLCIKTVKEDHFGEHLFFGAVKCTHCNQEVLNCQSFQLMIVNSKMGIESCKHSLRYCYDPFDYIRARLSGDSTCSSSGSFVPMYLLKRLSLYIGRIGILENKEPWGPAILQCKKLLPHGLMTSTGNTKSMANKNYNTGKSKTNLAAETPTLTASNDNHIVDRVEGLPETKDIETRQVTCSTLTNQNSFESKAPEAAVIELLLSQNYGLEQLEQAVEYVEVTGHCKLQNSTLPRKPEKTPRPYKKLKPIEKSRLSPLVIGKDQPEEEEMCTEFIETPANGYYYVVRHAIEECPMCYVVLCPSEFTVNVETFLMTTICSGCDLTIYIVHDSPDGSMTGVSIVTEEGPTNEPKPAEVNEKKKRKYTKSAKPKKPVKTSRASDFFAK